MAFAITQATNQLDLTLLQALNSTGVVSPAYEPGTVLTSTDGRKYQYVQFDNGSGNIAAVAGAPCAYAPDATDNECVVTSDLSDGGSIAIGCFLSVLTDTYYGWIQIAGFVKDVPVSGNQAEAAAGDALHGNTDATWSYTAVGSGHVKATAIEASVSGVGNIMLIG